MIASILTRTTRLAGRAAWEAALASCLPKIRELLEGEPGFVSIEYLWASASDGQFAQVTTWQTVEDCRRYVREGGAATVATLEDAAVPTAAHPNGNWVRQTFERVILAD